MLVLLEQQYCAVSIIAPTCQNLKQNMHYVLVQFLRQLSERSTHWHCHCSYSIHLHEITLGSRWGQVGVTLGSRWVTLGSR